MHDFFTRQFLTFLLAGGTAAAVNFGSRIIYNQWMSYSSAIILAYVTGMITAFILAKLFVFTESRQDIKRAVFYFTLVNLLAVMQTWLVSMALACHLLPWLGITWHAAEIAHAAGVMVPVFTSYLGHKRWSFR